MSTRDMWWHWGENNLGNTALSSISDFLHRQLLNVEVSLPSIKHFNDLRNPGVYGIQMTALIQDLSLLTCFPIPHERTGHTLYAIFQPTLCTLIRPTAS
jgi:hypothetical protein